MHDQLFWDDDRERLAHTINVWISEHGGCAVISSTKEGSGFFVGIAFPRAYEDEHDGVRGIFIPDREG